MKRNVNITRIFEENYLAPPQYTILCNKGGARSSKSYSIGQLFVKKLTTGHNRKILVTRKTMPALRNTAMKIILTLLHDYGYYSYCKHNKSNHTIEFGSNWLLFCSIDKPSKIRSTEFNDIWMEEANEFNYEDYMTLSLRLSAAEQEGPNRMYLSYNPSISCWINEKIISLPETKLIHSTYKDNPYLPMAYVKKLLSMKETDPNYYKVYALGEDGDVEGVIFLPFIDYFKDPNYDDVVYGLDFGYNHPTALLRVGFYDNSCYLKEHIYQTKLTTADLLELLPRYISDRSSEIYADAAEPDRIEEIKRAGYNIHPAKKSVLDGINCVKACNPIYCHYASLNLKKERALYMWKSDKDGNYSQDTPIKYNDHLIDALRYAIYSYKIKQGYTIGEAYTAHGTMSNQDF